MWCGSAQSPPWPSTPTPLYAGTCGGVFKSTDGGGSWSAANVGLSATSVLALAIDPQASTILYAGTSGGGAFKSSDGGGSWSAANVGLSATSVLALAIDPQASTTLYAGTSGSGLGVFDASISGGGVFKSTNGGGGGGPLNTGAIATAGSPGALYPPDPPPGSAGTSDRVFKSTDCAS